MMSEGPILHIYKYGRKQNCIQTLVNKGKAILLQEAEDGKLHPVYCRSKKTNTAEEKYDSYELEHVRRLYKKNLITRIARWTLQLEELNYEIEHRAGSRMKHVDALSRYPVMIRSLQKLSSTTTVDRREHSSSTIATGQSSSRKRTKLNGIYRTFDSSSHQTIVETTQRNILQIRRYYRDTK
ncbi:transposon Ty3-I Gag-Pol polyprotein [Trichonephila clavipes]|nr:transposon Ty3-I Gag-Pol polyprotein [Trichonephila clavipes]